VELVEGFARPRAGEEIFGLLKEAFLILCHDGACPVLKLAFELKLLKCSGFSPELQKCVRCQGEKFRLAAFSLEDGGVVCEACQEEKDLFLNLREIAVLRTLQRYPLSKLKRIRVPEGPLAKGAGLVEKFLVRILDRDIKALRIWKEMNERRPSG